MAERSDLSTIVVRANPVPDADATAEDFDAHRALLALIDERSAATDIPRRFKRPSSTCLLYTSDAADDRYKVLLSVGGG